MIGMYNSNSQPIIRDSDITAIKGVYAKGMYNIDATVDLFSVRISASGAANSNIGVFNQGTGPAYSRVTAAHSYFEGLSNSIENYSTSSVVEISNSDVQQPRDTSSGVWHCIHSYYSNAGLVELDDQCLPL